MIYTIARSKMFKNVFLTFYIEKQNKFLEINQNRKYALKMKINVK